MNKQRIILIITSIAVVALTLVAMYFYYFKRSPILLPGITQTPVPIPTFSGELPEGIKESEFAQIEFDANQAAIIQKLGEPDNRVEEENRLTLQYSNEYPDFPNDVILIDGNFSVSKEIIDPSDPRFNQTISDYVSGINGRTATSMIDPDYGDAYKVYVYPNLGFGLLAHEAEQVVFEVWTFEPSSMESILDTWGKDLLTQEEFDERSEEGHY